MGDNQRSLDELRNIVEDIHELLERQRLVEQQVEREERNDPRALLVENVVIKQHNAALEARLADIHPADIARILEMLPLKDRLAVWNRVKSDLDGEVLLETTDAVRESLIEAMDTDELVAATEQLDTDEIADLAPDLPDEVVQGIYKTLDPAEREQLRLAMSYPENVVGARMDFDMVNVREDVSVEVVLRYLRRLKELPDQTDQLFVVDRDEKLRGLLPLKTLLVSSPEDEVGSIMQPVKQCFPADGKLAEAAEAFERYDLVTAPVVDARHRLIGRLTVDAVVDFIKERQEQEQLSQGGLREEEDIFAPLTHSLKNRAPWLGINLVTALIASSVIGMFEESIEKLVALATLMPIVAGMGGNVGNQSITMIVRALANNPLTSSDVRNLYLKEMSLALANGLIFGALLALITFVMFKDAPLGGVMMLAVTLNFLAAAFFAVTIPVVRHRLGSDPALGSSVLITAITDSGGFFIFLGLASIFLLRG